uniref:Transmembrane protein putative n=1 Tax=Albugo laibachii Nc14 TaxID=890382 RepID=F0X0R6_9STRA|nr:transmembrane protein putative [Albugo laibachii Nc14]|eukprot:CCA27360.1 transmembrane protein putative [Albugo laibachii Nc14]
MYSDASDQRSHRDPIESNIAQPDESFDVQILSYQFIYVLQGMFLGLLGPSLGYFSVQASYVSKIQSPVASFGPIFSAHGGAALMMSFMSELIISSFIKQDRVKLLLLLLLACSSIWYALLTTLAGYGGSLGVSIYFIAKGFWSSLLNISISRCCLWITGEKIENGRRLITSLNIAFGIGTIFGSILALILLCFSIELLYAFYGLAVLTLIPAGILLCFPTPKSGTYQNEQEPLLHLEDPTRVISTVPSPIVGGVFLPIKHYEGSIDSNPDDYDPASNFIVLMVTILATTLFGIQLGLGAFLYDYIAHVLTSSSHPWINVYDNSQYILDHDSSLSLNEWCALLMTIFWAALASSYTMFSMYPFRCIHTIYVLLLSVVCMVSSFGLLLGIELGLPSFILCLVTFAFALSPLFTLSNYCLTRVINEALIRRVSSLIVFGAGMGEVFIPVLMGFFMGEYSGQMYGAVAVSYITFILSICLVGESSILLYMVKKKLRMHVQCIEGSHRAEEVTQACHVQRHQPYHAIGSDMDRLSNRMAQSNTQNAKNNVKGSQSRTTEKKEMSAVHELSRLHNVHQMGNK